MDFPTKYDQIIERMHAIDPVKYGRTRNFLDGDVSYLSPYISRGVISTKQVMEYVLSLGHEFSKVEKFIQELAWRDYWQQVWVEKGSGIDKDLRHPMPEVENNQMPSAIIEANTGVEAIDKGIRNFYETGYMHNHMRMYVAAIACNMGKSHWLVPAKWMYYHLLDADWASNALSWQWVAGSNSHKKYYANQENINKYCKCAQKNTFLDQTYEALIQSAIPYELKPLSTPDLKTQFPPNSEVKLNKEQPLLVYNFYNMDPMWRKDEEANRVLLLEPRVFDQYPVGQNSIEFLIGLGENISGIQVFVGSFDELCAQYSGSSVRFKEHPLNHHYKGEQDERDWMFSVKGYYPSFFKFWNKCRKELK